MKQITLRLPVLLLAELEREAEDRGVSRSEHVRDTLAERADVEELRERLERREKRISELEDQLRRRSDVEEKIENLPDKIREAETYQERRQRALDRASVIQRLRWTVTGVPVDEVEADTDE
jgi:predicted RNase H-like nuclease (RuvC/YqgF family)